MNFFVERQNKSFEPYLDYYNSCFYVRSSPQLSRVNRDAVTLFIYAKRHELQWKEGHRVFVMPKFFDMARDIGYLTENQVMQGIIQLVKRGLLIEVDGPLYG